MAPTGGGPHDEGVGRELSEEADDEGDGGDVGDGGQGSPSLDVVMWASRFSNIICVTEELEWHERWRRKRLGSGVREKDTRDI